MRFLTNIARQPVKSSLALLLTSGLLYGIFSGVDAATLTILAGLEGMIVNHYFDTGKDEDGSSR